MQYSPSTHSISIIIQHTYTFYMQTDICSGWLTLYVTYVRTRFIDSLQHNPLAKHSTLNIFGTWPNSVPHYTYVLLSRSEVHVHWNGWVSDKWMVSRVKAIPNKSERQRGLRVGYSAYIEMIKYINNQIMHMIT